MEVNKQIDRTNAQYLIAGNWKMNLLRADGFALAQEIAGYTTEHDMAAVQTVLCPVALHLQELSGFTHDTLAFGGQDCHAEAFGAHTGDIAAQMLADSGAEYVILGHSERRADHAESDAQVRAKAIAARQAGLIPIICVGETLEQRNAGLVDAVLAEQLACSIPEAFTAVDMVVAYEPVWAIGTGRVATAEIIAETHRMVSEKTPVGTKILYGGSVKAENAAEILSIPHVNGVLVGGASLKADSFCAIIAAAQHRLHHETLSSTG